MQEEREDLEVTLDEIEAYGEHFKCPQCDSKACDKPCFAKSCFDWCLTHSYPSVEDRDGTVSIKVHTITKDVDGQIVDRTEEEQRRICGSQEARDSPGNCGIITSPFVSDVVDGVVLTPKNQLWQFEQERYMQEVMGRESL
ncbi:hypothetical protein GGR58DRAFT_491681 [Xylaria digitata]|nr:hypothetical protein GGR58DRAFT_491681 [Xylaria digitata]